VLAKSLGEACHSNDLDSGHEFRLGAISRWNHDAPRPSIASGNNGGQNPRNRSNATVESELAHMYTRGDGFGWHITRSRQNRQRDGKVESAPLFWQACG
jgi:hypothetical protein